MSEWREITLGEVCKIKHGYAFKGEYITTERQSYILLTPGNFKIGGGLKFEKNKYFFGEIPEDYILKFGDLVVTMTDLSKKGDTLGYSGLIPDSLDAVLHNQRIGLITEISENIHKGFLHWRMRNNDYQLYIVGHSTGSTVRHTSPKTIYTYQFLLPPLPEQKAIADTLSCLDEKIESNNKINQTLEEMAFTLFERIFGIDTPTIPLSDIAEINPKRILPKKTLAKCIDMTKLSTSGCFPTSWDEKEFSGGMKFQNGDTLLARITPCLENGKTAYINFLEDGEVAFGSTEYVVISPKQGYCGEFFYCLARYPNFVSYAVQNMNGTSGRQRVSGGTIGEYELPVPDSVYLEEFNNVAPSFFDVIKRNSLENLRLAEIRNTLLPKLMSGEVRVPVGEVE